MTLLHTATGGKLAARSLFYLRKPPVYAAAVETPDWEDRSGFGPRLTITVTSEP